MSFRLVRYATGLLRRLLRVIFSSKRQQHSSPSVQGCLRETHSSSPKKRQANDGKDIQQSKCYARCAREAARYQHVTLRKHPPACSLEAYSLRSLSVSCYFGSSSSAFYSSPAASGEWPAIPLSPVAEVERTTDKAS
jgi:hypothetical protein